MDLSKNLPIEAVLKLEPQDFTPAFGEPPSTFVAKKIEEYGFQYRPLTRAERDRSIRDILEVLLHKDLDRAGAHRLEIWERGWGENAEQAKQEISLEALMPRYFHKFGQVRWLGEFIQPISKHFEYGMLASLQYWLFEKYLKETLTIYEFGCGTGHNLLRAREVNPRAALWGLDWASSSQEIMNRLRESGVEPNIFGHRFDYFNPDLNFKLAPQSAVVTVASLEQVGERHQAFLDYLIEQKPQVCVHIEPIGEVLDPQNLMDFLSLEYFKKRNYLNGFLAALKNRERRGEVRIERVQRTHIGSFFIEGYTVIVWAPLVQRQV